MGRFDDIDLTSKRKPTFAIVGLTAEEISFIRSLLRNFCRRCYDQYDDTNVANSILDKMGEE